MKRAVEPIQPWRLPEPFPFIGESAHNPQGIRVTMQCTRIQREPEGQRMSGIKSRASAAASKFNSRPCGPRQN